MEQGTADIGLIGLAVMGQNLVLNMADHGYKVAVFNRTRARTDEFLATSAKGKQIVGGKTLKEFFAQLKRPRKVMFMVKAGKPIDELIEECLPFLEKGDVIIDGGNSHYPDTERRVVELHAKGIFFLGVGISGGEEGARHGPSIMPGGNRDGWPLVKPIFEAIAAKAEEDGRPCCVWIGDGGAGHFVKMVHNGIEYGDMQIICEGYDLLKQVGGFSADELSKIFHDWNQGELASFLIEITSQIFKKKDTDGSLLLDKILDVAGQKGTGKWTAISALDLGIPVTLIGEAVFARCLSSLIDDRQKAASLYPKKPITPVDRKKLIDEVGQALYAAKILSYTQGFMLLRAAANEMKWSFDYGPIALIWRAGCIIRSRFLNAISEAFHRTKGLDNLLFDAYFVKAIESAEGGLRRTLAQATLSGIPTPALSAALSFFDGFRAAKLPANLLQAQRDLFGAHTYERIDKPRGQFFHTEWASSP